MSFALLQLADELPAAARPPGIWRWRLAFLLLPLSLSACVNPKPSPAVQAAVWPDPPEPARIQYVSSVSKPSDLGFKRSGLKRFANWLVGAENGNERFVKPFGIALDDVDNLCLTDTGTGAVFFFDAVRKRLLRWTGVGKISFASPVAVAKRGDVLYVADSARRSVISFDTRGALRFELRAGLVRPAGLAVSGTNLFVADSQRNSILVFDLQGQLLREVGRRGSGEGEFNFPTHLSIDAGGNLLVTDAMNGRVQLLDSQGRFLGRIGSLGDRPGHFGRPKGVAADSAGRIYVVDALYDSLQIFTRDGRLLLSLGGPGSAPGEFWLPSGIAISRDNRIFIADSYNRRVQILKYVGDLDDGKQ
jgi:DNA-binding beta-propeller fold protein YncE